MAGKGKRVWTASEMGRRGGRSRKRKMTAEQRSASAVHANKVRWARYRARIAAQVAAEKTAS
jgi:hypothetical protein